MDWDVRASARLRSLKCLPLPSPTAHRRIHTKPPHSSSDPHPDPTMSTERTPPSRTFTLASRASELAQIQTNIVRDALTAKHPSKTFATSFMATAGDFNQSQALYLIGGKALWTKELEVALQDNTVDMLVHSFKDVPTVLPEGCEIAGVLEREDPLDSLIVRKGAPEGWKSLDDLPEGSVVGTSSVRRVAQLKRKYPGLVFKDVVSKLAV